jgi:hypothetical protein
MKKRHLLPVLSLVASSLFAQVVPNKDYVTYPPTSGTREMIDNVPSALDLTNSAVYISGYTRSLVTGRDYLLIKYDLNGNILWQRTFDYAGLNDRALAITVDNSGNVIITGEATSASNGTDIITRKYDTNGNLLWSATYNGSANADDKALGVVTDNSGDVYLCGYTSNTGTGKDFSVIRYNSTGVQQYVYTKNGTANGDDIANAIAFFGNRLYLVGNVTNTSSGADIYITRLNANNANVNWSKTENGTASTNDQGLDVKVMGNDVLICGGVNNTGTGQDYFFGKYNATNGNTVFTSTYDAFGTNDFATSLVYDASNTYAITGLAQNGINYEYHTTKYNNSGTLSWINKHKTNAAFLNVYPKIAVDVIANHFYVSGVTFNSSIDAALYQITPGGNQSWVDYHDGFGLRDAHVDLSVDNFGRIYLASLNEQSTNIFDIALIRYSQIPVFFPLDLYGQPANLHSSFIPNLGQLHDESYNQVNNIKYYNTTLSPALYIEETKNHFAFLKADNDSTTPDSTHRIEMSFFIESSEFPKLHAFEPQATFLNFYTPNTAPNGITEVKGRQRLMVPNIYPNVDLHYYSNAEGIKYYFVVKPGGDPNSVFLKFTGATSTYTNGSGELIVNASWDGLKFKKPEVYQINTSLSILPLTGASWDNLGSDSYKVSTPVYNTALPLVIMVSKVPATTIPSSSGPWYTYAGGWGTDVILDIATEENGNLFSVGHTSNATLWPNPIGVAPVSGAQDAFMLKCDKDAKANWTTFYGGTGVDEFRSVAFGNFGVISTGMYVTGYTTSNNTGKIPIRPATNPFDGSYWDGTFNGASDGFIAKFAISSGTVTYSQYLGGCDDDAGNSIAIDSVIGRIYVAGIVDDNASDCASSTFPFKNSGNSNEFINTGHNNAGGANNDGFVFAMNVSNVQQYGTFLGGGGGDMVSEIIVNQNTGDFYVTGTTQYSNFSSQTGTPPFLALNDGNFPLVADAGSFFQSTKPTSAINNSYITRFNKNYEMLWSTLFEGDNGAAGTGIDVAPNGDVYATGLSFSTKSSTVNCGVPNDDGFPVCNPFQTTAYGNPILSDVYLARFNSNNAMLYSTLYSGDDNERWYFLQSILPPRVVVEKNNNVFVTGVTVHDGGSSNSFPTLNKPGLYNQAVNSSSIVNVGSSDAFVFWFDAANQRTWSTHFGGPDASTTNAGNEIGYGIAIFGSTQLYIAGSTSTYTLPLACPPNVSGPPYCKTNNSNSMDGFIARFDMATFIGINEQHKNLTFTNSLEVYPNPSSSVFNLTYKAVEYNNYKITVHNSLGQIIFEKDLGKTSGNFISQVDLSNFTDGLYIISLVSNDQLVSKKIIKQ